MKFTDQINKIINLTQYTVKQNSTDNKAPELDVLCIKFQACPSSQSSFHILSLKRPLPPPSPQFQCLLYLDAVEKFADFLYVLDQRPEVPHHQVQGVRGEETVVGGLVTLISGQIPHTQLNGDLPRQVPLYYGNKRCYYIQYGTYLFTCTKIYFLLETTITSNIIKEIVKLRS